jgi:hypothetical protein
VDEQLQLVEEYNVKVDKQRVHPVELVQAWQLEITVEHVTQVLEVVLKYCAEVQEVQLDPFVPLSQRVQ